MDPRFDVLGLGSTSVDDILYVQSYPAPDTKARVVRRERRCGGLTGTALVSAARLGARCAYAGRLGFDDNSRLVVENLAREGIDASHAPRARENSVVAATIIVALDNGTRNVFSCAYGSTGAHDQLPPEGIIQNSRALFVDHHGVNGAIRACNVARASGVPIVADLERADHTSFPQLLAAVDHLVISEAFARRLTGCQLIQDAVRALWHPTRSAVVVTCGSRGCYFTESGETVGNFPALDVEARDTSGCGDVFHGAYVAGLAFGFEMRQRLELASAAAALYASRTDGHSIPRRSEVARFLETTGLRSPLSRDEGFFP